MNEIVTFSEKQKWEHCFPVIRAYKKEQLLPLEDKSVKTLPTPVLAAFLLKVRNSIGRRNFEETAKVIRIKFLEWQSSTKSSKETETWNYWIVLWVSIQSLPTSKKANNTSNH